MHLVQILSFNHDMCVFVWLQLRPRLSQTYEARLFISVTKLLSNRLYARSYLVMS
jgi:hypothetical protein